MLQLARRFFGPYKAFLTLGPIAKVVEVIFDLLTPLVIAWMIDAGVVSNDVHVLFAGGGLLILFAILGILFTLVTQKMASITSQGISTHIREALFTHVNRLSFQDLDSLGSSSLLTRITNDTNQIQLACAMLIRQVIRWPILAVGAIVCALILSPTLGLIFVICLPVIALVFYFIMKRQVTFFQAMQMWLDKVGLLVSENLSGVRVIRAFCRENLETKRFKEASAELARSGTRAAGLSAILNPATFLVINGGICLILWLGAMQVEAGSLQPGQVMAFIGYLNQLLVSIAYVANLVVIFTRAEASAQRINTVLDWKPSVARGGNALPVSAHTSEDQLTFLNVSFAYPGATINALNNISFTLQRGERLGIIGGTGSGKSTLVNLIPRMLEPTQGTVSFEGIDAASISQESLHESIGFVPQHASLLSGTIRENLTWRDSEATDKELWEALKVAQAAAFVKQKEGQLETAVTIDGKNFSGGQRQRLTIARALVGKPNLLVLDDSASALDYATDAALRKTLKNLSSHPATILISQRVATVRDADKILVLDKGNMVGYGTHQDLVKTCPLYLEICKTQLREEEILA